jgi:hypothetical protein
MEGAPAILPIELDRLGDDLSKRGAERCLSILPSVDGQLESAGAVALLEALRGEPE